MRETFYGRFTRLSAERGPLCVGLDPTPDVLRHWGLPDSAAGAASLTEAVVASTADLVAVFKPQSAFFERFGPDGVRALHDSVGLIKDAGCLCLVDVKRGDIGSTVHGYASAYLRPGGGFEADAITLHAFLGLDALEPAFTACFESGTAVFVVVLSSNPEGRSIQTARTDDGRTVVELLVDGIVQWNLESNDPVGPVGAVLGVTSGESAALAARLSNGMILAPGLGAQGGRASDVEAMLEAAPGRVLPSASRSVLMQGPSRDYLRVAVASLQESLRP
ncbi:MAG TPA: orotidine-5'-phosphate decarboxylase [Actinomycetota bacterium]|nr:orotidine-5'-phosphate decarboxylase [Actinomycetota bacterium]